MKKFERLQVFAAALAGILLVQAGLGLLVKAEVERRAGVRLEGRYVPVPLRWAFYLKNVRVDAGSKFKVSAGDLEVRYSLLPFGPERFRVRLKGMGLKIQLLDKWAKIQGTNGEVPVTRFDADLRWAGKHMTLESIHLDSPSFQFNIQPSAGGPRQPGMPLPSLRES